MLRDENRVETSDTLKNIFAKHPCCGLPLENNKSSILLDCNGGWIISHFNSIGKDYHMCYDWMLGQELCYRSRPELFAIHERFRMDSEYKALDLECKGNDDPPKIKKRKRKPKQEIDTTSYHYKIKDIIENPINDIIRAGRQKNLFSPHQHTGNNKQARDAANFDSICDFAGLCELAMVEEGSLEPDVCDRCILTKQTIKDGPASTVNTLVTQAEDTPMILKTGRGSYLLPAKCTFLMSDITCIGNILKDGAVYDFIVVDPPWENKSVKRKKKYRYLNDSDFLSLPVGQVAAKNCIVAVWVTNKQKQINFVKEKLFPHWGVTYSAVWHWVKVTSGGDMVYDFNSPHKKPYENLIIGQFQADTLTIPDHKVLVSIPSSIHSSKPHIEDVFSSMLPEDPRCLELFSRNLRSKWTSWGNEVLRHQDIRYFTPEGAR